jgi:hypothetical protein
MPCETSMREIAGVEAYDTAKPRTPTTAPTPVFAAAGLLCKKSGRRVWANSVGIWEMQDAHENLWCLLQSFLRCFLHVF